MQKHRRTLKEIEDHTESDCPYHHLHPWGCAFEILAGASQAERLLRNERGIVTKEDWLNTRTVGVGFDPQMRLHFAFRHQGSLIQFTSAQLGVGVDVRHIAETLNGLVRMLLNGPPGLIK